MSDDIDMSAAWQRAKPRLIAAARRQLSTCLSSDSDDDQSNEQYSNPTSPCFTHSNPTPSRKCEIVLQTSGQPVAWPERRQQPSNGVWPCCEHTLQFPPGHHVQPSYVCVPTIPCLQTPCPAACFSANTVSPPQPDYQPCSYVPTDRLHGCSCRHNSAPEPLHPPKPAHPAPISPEPATAAWFHSSSRPPGLSKLHQAAASLRYHTHKAHSVYPHRSSTHSTPTQSYLHPDDALRDILTAPPRPSSPIRTAGFTHIAATDRFDRGAAASACEPAWRQHAPSALQAIANSMVPTTAASSPASSEADGHSPPCTCHAAASSPCVASCPPVNSSALVAASPSSRLPHAWPSRHACRPGHAAPELERSARRTGAGQLRCGGSGGATAPWPAAPWPATRQSSGDHADIAAACTHSVTASTGDPRGVPRHTPCRNITGALPPRAFTMRSGVPSPDTRCDSTGGTPSAAPMTNRGVASRAATDLGPGVGSTAQHSRDRSAPRSRDAVAGSPPFVEPAGGAHTISSQQQWHPGRSVGGSGQDSMGRAAVADAVETALAELRQRTLQVRRPPCCTTQLLRGSPVDMASVGPF